MNLEAIKLWILSHARLVVISPQFLASPAAQALGSVVFAHFLCFWGSLCCESGVYRVNGFLASNLSGGFSEVSFTLVG